MEVKEDEQVYDCFIIVSVYYRLSPPVADVIARSDVLQASVRTLLEPSAPLLILLAVFTGGLALKRSS